MFDKIIDPVCGMEVDSDRHIEGNVPHMNRARVSAARASINFLETRT